MEGALVIVFSNKRPALSHAFCGTWIPDPYGWGLGYFFPNKGPALSYAFCGTWTPDPYGGGLGYFSS